MMYNLGSMHCIINTANSTRHGTEPVSEPEGQLVSYTCLKTLQPAIKPYKTSLMLELVCAAQAEEQLHPSSPPLLFSCIMMRCRNLGLSSAEHHGVYLIWKQRFMHPKVFFSLSGLLFQKWRRLSQSWEVVWRTGLLKDYQKITSLLRPNWHWVAASFARNRDELFCTNNPQT